MLFREEFELIRMVLGGGVGIALDLAHTGPCTRIYESCLYQMLVPEPNWSSDIRASLIRAALIFSIAGIFTHMPKGVNSRSSTYQGQRRLILEI
jgi:hypothetical protein